MLEELRIRGLGVIEETVLPLGPGLTVVTGETGAGKTMVVTALLLLFGGRADAARVRAGADQATLDGRVLPPDPSSVAARVADAGGQLDDDGGLTLRRTVAATGRSRAYAGGAPAPVGLLAELGEQLVSVHGQADHLRLARPAEQRAALDRFAGIDAASYAASYALWRQAAVRLADRLARARELRREFDLLQHGLAEIETVDPQPDEDVALAVATSRLAHADALRLAARIAHDALLGDADDPSAEHDVATLLGWARRALDARGGDDPQLDEFAVRLADLTAAALDLGTDLGAYGERIDADPPRLAELEARRAALGALTRKYADERTGPAGIPGVLAWADEARARLTELDVSDEALATLAAERDVAAARAALLAGELSTARAKAADELAQQVSTELAGLAMPGARLHILVRARPAAAGGATLCVDGHDVGAGPDGVDDVEILLQSRADTPALALSRGASGGELARVMLAVEVCLAGTDPVPTMVFDEVDAGVGGRAAVEVGRRLAQLAIERQVLVVTHLAQVAAYADRQVVVDRTGDAGVTRSNVRIVDGTDRVVELARMLAGSDSDTAREHATELLASAGADRRRRRTGARKGAR
jgi:DNA repair protein RecN (Recombination protein N)